MTLPVAPVTVIALPETEIKGPSQALYSKEVVPWKVTTVLSFKSVKSKVVPAGTVTPSMMMLEHEDFKLESLERLELVIVHVVASAAAAKKTKTAVGKLMICIVLFCSRARSLWDLLMNRKESTCFERWHKKERNDPLFIPGNLKAYFFILVVYNEVDSRFQLPDPDISKFNRRKLKSAFVSTKSCRKTLGRCVKLHEDPQTQDLEN
ncbi:hypothetical protein WICPIJ_000329 [Wickerhamomyces pijperi]|uniref:Uncharacterized protein n=1 Tax=Wickerhamomyces pijperi TaxID=599730 RepID=A0A9P8QCT9_WICPI|nr:hypothetical protein WICPIJ_000329 [Wickerhamomyces pijperi]